MNENRIHVEDRDMFNEIVLYFIQDNAICTNMTFETMEEGTLYGGKDPVRFRLRREHAQSLLDRLWNMGFRPADTRYNSDSLNIMRSHLEDMRKIAFTFLEKPDA